MKKLFFSAVLALTFGLMPVCAVASQPAALVDLTQAAETSVNSVVYIKVVSGGKMQTVVAQDHFGDIFDFFGFGFGGRGGQQRQVQTPKRQSAGSGVIISRDGYIVTNNHVVKDADQIEVKLNDNREFTGRIIGLDETTDLALIKVDAKDLPAITIGNSDDLKLGQWVLAVGNPFNLTSTVTAGIVSAKARTLGANGIESFIQTDAAINAGNSGGALVNERGELVGINAMLVSQTGNNTGYGFAIPTTIMNKVVADLKEFGVVQRALLGVSGTDVTNYIDSEREKGNEVDLGTVTGVYVNSVSEGSAAEEAGLQKGDVVTNIDGREVKKMAELQEALSQHRPGDKVGIKYVRNKSVKTANVTLRNAQGNTTVMEEVDIDDFGVQLVPLGAKEKSAYGLSYGLLVNNIRKGKLQSAGMTKGMIILVVNDQRMNSTEDWEEAVRMANKSSDRTLWIRAVTSSGRKASFVVDLNEK
ncbi:MAG: trypsin-like peptidase domain-containing protein [Bacteroidales bacterium]|nr:trypsin-like peptidase domain-containing protein [Candidatus Physcousia equi]